MPKLTLTIHMDGAAFTDPAADEADTAAHETATGHELARLLNVASHAMATGAVDLLNGATGAMVDANGNTVGRWSLDV